LKVIDRSLRFTRGFLLSYGPQWIKRRFWDSEYRSDKWNFADNTSGDCVYAYLERYARKGSILDLGCGSGNTGTELVDSAYTSYIGVDISEEALAKAAKRSQVAGRAAKNSFQRSDFLSFEPAGEFDVILFRESMYHIPISDIPRVLDKYAPYLKEDGVFIVRLYTVNDGQVKHRPLKMIDLIASRFAVLERGKHGERGSVVIVFRPQETAARRSKSETDSGNESKAAVLTSR
jgi:SAM-dependent methyltransferase